jgi:hypothetical protein
VVGFGSPAGLNDQPKAARLELFLPVHIKSGRRLSFPCYSILSFSWKVFLVAISLLGIEWALSLCAFSSFSRYCVQEGRATITDHETLLLTRAW